MQKWPAIAALTLGMLGFTGTRIFSQVQPAKSTQNKAITAKPETTKAPTAKQPDQLSDEERAELEEKRAEVETTLQCPAQFIVSLALDRDPSEKPFQFNYNGGVWVGTEDNGVYYYQTSEDGKESWTKFTTKDGLGDDNAYAITVDRLGRVWVGHLNHGVSVFNGEKWQNYDIVTGPLGPRIFAMATSPVDGDVWMATDAGLARYSLSKNTWSYYTRTDGLPSDQAQALAFDKSGKIFVGTQCDGIAISSPASEFKSWRVIRGPEQVPVTPSGSGLPTSLINCLTILPNGNICAGTATGLAYSRDGGNSWNYIRGRDYASKVKGLWNGPPKGWKEPDKKILDNLLLEDYITGLAADSHGYVWIAYRQKGYEILDTVTNRKYRSKDDERLALADGYISAVQPLPDDSPLIARYGGKLVKFAQKLSVRKKSFGLAKLPIPAATSTPAKTDTQAPPFPADAVPPTTEELAAMQAKIRNNTSKVGYPFAMYLGDDWATQGDWVGRYGRNYAVLCAMMGYFDHTLNINLRFKVDKTIGPVDRKDGDSLRGWIHWVKTQDKRSLYNPLTGYRRQAEWDDHGETYPMNKEGPDVWIKTTIPKGLYRVSTYFFNKDGHASHNRFRDYRLEVYARNFDPKLGAISSPLATSRVINFWGGVYKQFALSGPGTYYFCINRNYSFNTIVSAVLIDEIADGIPYPANTPLPWMGMKCYEPQSYVTNNNWGHEIGSVVDLWNQRHANIPSIKSLLGIRELNTQSYRILANSPPTVQVDDVLENWRWQLKLWTDNDRLIFNESMLAAWQSQVKATPELANESK